MMSIMYKSLEQNKRNRRRKFFFKSLFATDHREQREQVNSSLQIRVEALPCARLAACLVYSSAGDRLTCNRV